jgi:hypothetical protein
MLIKKGGWRQKSIWECDVCKKHFLITNSRAGDSIKKGSVKMCSKFCISIWRKTLGIKNVHNALEKNPSLNPRLTKGCGLTTDGYVWIRVVGKKHNNQIKVHRYLMEAKLRRPLKSHEIVHHKDGDKLNNSLNNLEILTISNHNKKHGHLKAEKRNDIWSEEELKACVEKSYVDFALVYNRTRGAYHQMRSRIRKNKRILRD